MNCFRDGLLPEVPADVPQPAIFKRLWMDILLTAALQSKKTLKRSGPICAVKKGQICKGAKVGTWNSPAFLFK
jgi:hypothetical protein